ncbi:MAG: hypothetical protein ACLFWB_11745 [Armatimonadota bacterium]
MQSPNDAFSIVKYLPDTQRFHLVSADETYEIIFTSALEVDGELWTLDDADDVETDGRLEAGNALKLTAIFTDHRLHWKLAFSLSADGATFEIASQLLNTGDSPASLDWCCPLFVGSRVGEARLPAEAVFLQSSGRTSPSRVYRLQDAQAPRESAHLLHIVNNVTGRALHCGFTSFDTVPPKHVINCDETGECRELACICDFGGWELQPGEKTRTEHLVIEARQDPYASLHHWADRVQEHYAPDIWPKTPGGWLGWAWVDAFNIETYEDIVIRNAEAIRRRLGGFDIEYIWVSIGNIGGGLPGNWLEWNEECFPHGHRWLVDELDRLDFRLGLWCGLFYVTGSLDDIVDRLHDALLKTDDELTVALPSWRYGDAGRLPEDERPCVYALDPTHPDGERFLRDVFSTYHDWGVRYYMLDFLHATADGDTYDGYHDTSIVPGLPVMRRGLQIATETAGSETYTLSSSGPTFACCPFITSSRMGNDYGEGRAINRESHFYPATYVINDPEFWTSHKRASDNLAASFFSHRKLFVNDSCNVMTVDKPIPLCEAQVTTTLFGICGGPVMLGDDVDRISEERLSLIKKVFPRTQEIAHPVDLFDTPEPDYPKIFHLHVDAGWDEWELLAVINYDDETIAPTVAAGDIGLAEDAPYRVWDFWNERFLGVHTGRITVEVPPHSVRLLRISDAEDTPAVISTDMHITQGGVELNDVVWDPETMTLSGTAMRPGGETGNVFVNAPAGLAVTNPQGLWIAKDGPTDSLIIRIQLQFDGDPQEWAVSFEQYE